MMKKLNYLLLTTGIALITVGSLFAKDAQSEQNRKVATFSGIEVSGGIKVIFSQGDQQSVVVKTDKDVQEKVKTEVDDNVLKIYFDSWKNRSNDVTVTIYMKDIKSLSSSGGSSIESTKPIVAGNLNIDLSGGSKIDIEVKAIEISGELSGASELKLKGAAGYLNISSSGASKCQSVELTVAKANISASGASSIEVSVDKEIRASASGASNIRYKGNPQIVKEDESGGASISKE
jgi:hypothetical protein